MAGQEIRIPKLALRVVPGLLFSIAIIAAQARTVIRYRQNRKLLLDDVFVIFACICLTSATVLFYLSISATYLVETIILDPTAIEIPHDFLDQVLWYQKGTYCYLALSWTAIFSIKASFLCFFKQMIDRLYGIMIYWRIVVGITAAVFVLCVCAVFIACPHIGLTALSCSMDRTFAVGYTAIALDILTDLLITSIPIFVLWNVNIRRRQKLSLAVFLCLNIVMIIVASIRMSGLHIGTVDTVDLIWELLWQQVECCIGVIMVSFITFRTAFVGENSLKKKRRWYSPGENMWYRKKRSTDDEHNIGNLPIIPSATLTGMRTFIQRNSETDTAHVESDVDERSVENVSLI